MEKTPITEALSRYGEAAIPGGHNNPDIVAMFGEAGHAEIQNDEVPWCSAFINSVMSRCGYPQTFSLAARSWEKLGTVETQPQIGDVAIFWRVSPESGLGHVALFIREEGDYIYVLGGNQKNMVNIQPMAKSQLIGYRRLVIE